MNRPRAFMLLFATTASLLVGCARAATQGRSSPGNGTTLTQAELARTNAGNLYDAIAKLQPQWLESRGATSVTDATPTGVDVYMNGTFLGKADYLRDVRLQDVSSIKYWDAGQAAARFGMGHPRGVLEIIRE